MQGSKIFLMLGKKRHRRNLIFRRRDGFWQNGRF
jgi:hypothetical protein